MEYKIIEPKKYQDIQNQYQVNSLLAKVIDIHEYDQETLQTLLSPRLIYHDFSLFEEADMTLERIHEAIENEEKICIYGDYDCDGILATTILVQAFAELGVQVGYHIPNRFDDGYGLNAARVKQMAQRGYSLIITVDNGVKAFDAVECANELGVDVIITDHHQFDNDLPDAMSFIHTKLSPEYPFKEISGGFVAYKLASALLEKQDKYLYCLAAITTISDMMPLLDENRSLVKKALTFMKSEKYPSLELLLGDQQSYTTTTIGFTIAPKINSFGRLPELCNPNILVKYFLKDAPRDLMMKVAQMATQINSKRQALTNEQYTLASEKMNDEFLYWAIGGHSLAGGFSIDEDHFESFYHCIEENLKDVELHATTNALLIDENDLSIENIESLAMLEPFGMGNEEPLYLLKDVPVMKFYQLSGGKHLKMDIDFPRTKMTALYFQQGQLFDELKDKKYISIVGTLSVNEFRNQKSINFIIKDIV